MVPGVWTILFGKTATSISGTPRGRQYDEGLSFPSAAKRRSYNAAAAGFMVTSSGLKSERTFRK